MASAGDELLEVERVLRKTDDTIVGEALRDGGVFYQWHHYPEGDVYDPETHAQYFYHAHATGQRTDEHGHFHTFLRPRGMPVGAAPLLLPELAIADAPAAPHDPLLAPVAQPNQGGNNDKLSHLIGIAMDRNGLPSRLFTTNRWVTGETWYSAADVCAMLDRFSVDMARPSWPLNRWISAMFRLFKPQMAELLLARDAAIMNWRRRHRGKIHVFEDRRLEVTSALDIDVAAQIELVALALRRAA
ncbi:MAG: hypothetical protein JWL84_6309 [Rhodospirillales bacterium]|jgi:hypothetical protein|nr:hypothetical protein [Rhodospirillales bacterium]